MEQSTMVRTGLYLIALLPPKVIALKEAAVKQRMADRYGVFKALNNPSYISLNAPLKLPYESEQSFLDHLREFAAGRAAFDVSLRGFDHFLKHTIYIKVVDFDSIDSLHKGLRKVLLNRVGIDAPFVDDKKIIPHMTVAYRDVSPEQFEAIWTEYRIQHFEEKFRAEALYLLKHTGKAWKIFQKFPFSGKPEIKGEQLDLFV